MLGKCLAPSSCSYKHNAALRADSKQVDVPKVEKAWEAYKASNTT
jgi:hypothetical protein